MRTIPEIQEVMTAVPQCIEFDRPLREARSLFRDLNIRHLPVTSGERFVGVLSDRDLRVAEVIEERSKQVLTAGDACVTDAYVVEPDTSLDVVVREMSRGRYGSAIVASAGEVLGIFTTVDACREFSDFLKGRSFSA